MPNRKKLRNIASTHCIVFDLFGVLFSKGLAGSIHHLENIFRRDAAQVAPTYSKWENEFDLGQINENQFWERINLELKTNVDNDLLTHLVLTSYKIDARVVQMVKHYRRHAMIVAYSNYRREWFDRLDKEFKVSPMFDRIFISSDTKLLKPDRNVFQYIATEMGIKKKDIVVVDDDPKNIKSANESECTGILFRDIYTADYSLRSALADLNLTFDAQYSGVLLETKEGALILQRRSQKADIANPGLLSVFGGRRNRKENAIDCAQRELMEETGLAVKKNQLEPICVLSCPIEHNKWMECTYFRVRNVDLSDVMALEGDSIAVRWPETALRDSEITEIARTLIREIYGPQFS